MKNRDYTIFLTGTVIAVACQLMTNLDSDIKGFASGFAYSLIVYFFIKVACLKLIKNDASVDASGMTSRDYTILVLGGLIASLGYVFTFKDVEVGNFLKAMGFTIWFAFTIKLLYKFILKHKHETTRG